MDSPFTNLDGTTIPFEKIEYKHLTQLTDFDEGYKLEFKSVFDNAVKNKLSKSICSFANCSGGWLFIGVTNETKQIVDIPKPNGEIELNIINSIKRFVDPEVLNLIKVRFIENPNNPNNGVIAININEGLHPPYISNGAIYVRAGAQSDPVPAERATIDILYKKSDRTSILLLKGIRNNCVQDNYEIQQIAEYEEFEKNAEDLYKEILTLIHQNNTKLPSINKDIEGSKISPKSSNEQNSLMSKVNVAISFAIGKEQNIAEYLKTEIDTIKSFVDALSIDCDIDSLLSFGDLKIFYNVLTLSTTSVGTDEEKARINDIISLSDKIKKYCAEIPLYSVAKYKYRLDLAIANNGNYYDEDIVVTIKIPKGSYCDFTTLTLYSLANEDNMKLIKTIKQTNPPIVDDYDNYGPYPYNTVPLESIGLSGLVENKAEKKRRECENDIKYAYEPFELISSDEYYDAIKIRFNKLNPNQIKSFPAPLLINCEINEIEYTIVSKYSMRKAALVIKRV